ENRLAVALPTPSANTIELFDFVDSTGTVTNFRSIDLSEPSGDVYGVGFSPGGEKLYATILGSNSIYELAYDEDTDTYETGLPPLGPAAGQPGAIQRGPDGQLYVAVNGQTSLGTISPNADVLQSSTFNDNGFAL